MAEVSALKALVGRGASAVDLRMSEACELVNICVRDAGLCSLLLSIASEARTAGLGNPPDPDCRLLCARPPAVPFWPLVIDSVRDSSASELDVDFGFGAGRLTGSIERSVGASLVASLEVFELESGLVTVGLEGISRRTISVFFGCEFFFRVNGDGASLVDATSLRRGRRVSCPEDSAGLSSVVFFAEATFAAGRGVLFAGCFLISVLFRVTRACGRLGRCDSFESRGSVWVSREFTDRLCGESARFGRASLTTDFCDVSRRTSFTTFRSADVDDEREIESASAAAVIASLSVGVFGLAAGEGFETAIEFSAGFFDFAGELIFS